MHLRACDSRRERSRRGCGSGVDRDEAYDTRLAPQSNDLCEVRSGADADCHGSHAFVVSDSCTVLRRRV